MVCNTIHNFAAAHISTCSSTTNAWSICPSGGLHISFVYIYIPHNHVMADSEKMTLNSLLLDKSCEQHLRTVDQISPPLDQFLHYTSISHYN